MITTCKELLNQIQTEPSIMFLMGLKLIETSREGEIQSVMDFVSANKDVIQKGILQEKELHYEKDNTIHFKST
ncbi:hypothetical protein UF28_16435 [Vibrio parahaemolyticus]|nr:hypothetical protein UF28_16435 [Vibrio parahaemolyticus]